MLLTFDQQTVRIHELRTGPNQRSCVWTRKAAHGEVKVAVAPNGRLLAVRFPFEDDRFTRIDKLYLVER